MMTNEQKIEQIKSYMNDIEELKKNKDLTINERQHLSRALETYNAFLDDIARGKIDPDFVFENITSYLYVLQ